MVSDRSNGIYRGILAAVVGLALIGAGEPPKQDAGPDQSNAQAGIADSLEGIASALKSMSKPDETAQPCSPENPNRNSDLCAQWKAADAAADAADWASWQFLLGGFGIAIGFVTMIAAIKAALFAKEAAKETKRGADIAWEVGLAQSSPYLTVDEAQGFQSDGIKIIVSIANLGASPASGIIPFGIFYVGDTNNPQIVARIKRSEKSKSAVGAHLAQTLELTCASQPDADLPASLQKGMITPGTILLGIRYSDEFGNTWIQRQRINVRIWYFKTDTVAAHFKFEGTANKVAPPRRRIGRTRNR
jgi:hypothetical protein